ncbi:MAG: polyhydroxybutyrate depolymerase [Deltaproteobacteria bacterium]|nr:polyhydroxybutyrate depolymerase [Deltaproteobacteria bacterium]
MRMKTILLVIAVVLALAAGAVAARRSYFTTPEFELPQVASTIQRDTVEVGGRTRSFLIYAPRMIGPSAPLIIVFHGSGQSADEVRRATGYGFDRIADRSQLAVVYAEGYQGNWNDCRKAASYAARKENIDDVGFALAIVEKMHARYQIEPARVFAVGYSSGAQMAIRLALEAPSRIAGIAAIAAGVPTPDNMDCKPVEGGHVPAMIVDGTDDPINPFKGGNVSLFGFASRGHVLSAKESGAFFAQRNAMAGPPAVMLLPRAHADDPTDVERTIWDEPGKREVELDAVRGGGHVIPTPHAKNMRALGATSTNFDAPEEIWKFFSRQLPLTQPNSVPVGPLKDGR